MINVNDLLDAIVTMLRSNEDLVTALGGTAEDTRIEGYYDTIQEAANSRAAMLNAKTPTLLIMWQQTGPHRTDRRELWRHDYIGILKANQNSAAVFDALVNGIPSLGCGMRMLYTEVVDDCYSMEVPMMARRQVMLNETQFVDYFEISLSYVEKGDR